MTAGNNAIARSAQTTKAAAANTQAANTSPAPAEGIDSSSFKLIDAGSLKSDDLKGIDVIGADGRKLAEIDDFVLTAAGKVDAVLVDFGGFLGVGKKEVAIAFDGLRFLSDPQSKRYLQVNVTKQQLDSQRAYNKDDYAVNRSAERLVVGSAPAAPAPAPDQGTAPAAAAGGMDMSTLKTIDMASLKSDELKGIDVIGLDGTKLAEINDFVLTSAGKVDAVLVDFGGFLGIGKKQVAIAFEGLKFLADKNNKRYLQVNVTKEELDAQRAYDKDDYAANRAAERLVVGSANAVAAKSAEALTAGTDPSKFTEQAVASNLYEIVSSQLVLLKSQNADIKAFAQKMIDDHTKVGADMKAAAASQGVTLPAAPSAAQQAEINRLNGLSGEAFDSAYVADQLKAHADKIALFQGYSTTGPLGAIKDFATKTLPVLQTHSDMVEKLKK